MIHLIGIGNDKGDITLNAFKAIKDADIIINYDNVDLRFFESEIQDKEVISAIDLQNGLDLELDLEEIEDALDSSLDDNLNEELENADLDASNDEFLDSSDLNISDDELEDLSEKPSLLEKLQQENYIIELAISKSLEDKDVVLISSDEPNILGLSNRFLQIVSKYSNVNYQIHPGVSSISSAAANIGAPLTDFAVVNLSNPILPLSEFETKINNILEANLILVVKNPLDSDCEYFNGLSKIVENFDPSLLTAIAKYDGSYKIKEFLEIKEEDIDSNSILFIGNRLSYLLDGKMISSSDYILEPRLMSYNIEFFEKYLNDETPKGIDYECDYLPCHKGLEACDFCYCPFYPCADGLTGGEWIKDRDVWSCQDCDWIHQEDSCKLIREGLDDLFHEMDDLKRNHIELLKLRREVLLKTKR